MATKEKAPEPLGNWVADPQDDFAGPTDMVEVVSGPHKGAYGAVRGYDPGSDIVLITTRDENNETLSVKHGDLRPTARRGR